jgi:FtsP/CotA-like multicopper oxidase with cupredoxin domain
MRTINGLYMPTITMQPGKLEFWRIGNQSSNIFYELTLDGLPFHILAIDGNLQNRVITTETLLLPPGGRLEALVYGPEPGKYDLQAEDFNTGPDGDAYPGQLMATIESEGTEVAPIPLPSNFPPLVDMTTVPLTGTKTVVFDDTANPDQFVIDGKPFSPNCIDYIVMLGSTEEWTILNAATEAHVFHIHQLDFQVTEINGVAKPFTGYQDVVTLPSAIDDDTPSEVKVIIPFTDPVMVGEFVYHCHIIQHEDQGMMAAIFVQDPQGPPPDSPLCQ